MVCASRCCKGCGSRDEKHRPTQTLAPGICTPIRRRAVNGQHPVRSCGSRREEVPGWERSRETPCRGPEAGEGMTLRLSILKAAWSHAGGWATSPPTSLWLCLAGLPGPPPRPSLWSWDLQLCRLGAPWFAPPWLPASGWHECTRGHCTTARPKRERVGPGQVLALLTGARHPGNAGWGHRRAHSFPGQVETSTPSRS